MRVIVLRTCCVAPPAANDWFWNVPRLEYTASGLAPPKIFAPGTEARERHAAHPLHVATGLVEYLCVRRRADGAGNDHRACQQPSHHWAPFAGHSPKMPPRPLLA